MCQFRPFWKANLDPRELYDLPKTKQGKITQNIFLKKWFALSVGVGSVGFQKHKKCTINAHYHYLKTINLDSQASYQPCSLAVCNFEQGISGQVMISSKLFFFTNSFLTKLNYFSFPVKTFSQHRRQNQVMKSLLTPKLLKPEPIL